MSILLTKNELSNHRREIAKFIYDGLTSHKDFPEPQKKATGDEFFTTRQYILIMHILAGFLEKYELPEIPLGYERMTLPFFLNAFMDMYSTIRKNEYNNDECPVMIHVYTRILLKIFKKQDDYHFRAKRHDMEKIYEDFVSLRNLK